MGIRSSNQLMRVDDECKPSGSQLRDAAQSVALWQDLGEIAHDDLSLSENRLDHDEHCLLLVRHKDAVVAGSFAVTVVSIDS